MAGKVLPRKIAPLVNRLKPDSFLELGTWRGDNFRAIRCPRKVSVDINGKGTFQGTTDKFFAENTARFDIVFIDACHQIEFVRRDWNNAIKITDRLIVLHDMVPPTPEFVSPSRCGNGYLLLAAMIEAQVEHRTLNEDYGLTVVLAKHFREFPDTLPAVPYQQFLPKVRTCLFPQLVAYAKKGFA